MKNTFCSLIPRPPLLNEPPERGRVWILDILITLLLFNIANVPITIITTPILLGYFSNNLNLGVIEIGVENFDFFSLLHLIEQITDSVLKAFENMPAWISLVMLFTFVFITITVIFCRLKIEKGSLFSLGIKKEGAVKQYSIGLLIGFVVFSSAVGIGLLSGGLEFDGFSVFSVSNLIYIPLFFVGYMVQGMAEEILCRGYLLTALTRRYSVLTAVLISSVFFALLHIGNPGISVLAFINLFLYGVFAALVMLKTDNIWMASAIHSIWNFTQGNLYGIRVSGSSRAPSVINLISTERTIWNGGAFGMEGGLGVTIVLVAGITIILAATFKHNKQQKQL